MPISVCFGRAFPVKIGATFPRKCQPPSKLRQDTGKRVTYSSVYNSATGINNFKGVIDGESEDLDGDEETHDTTIEVSDCRGVDLR